VLHTFFFVPYFSWQYSHAKHHRRTNDMVQGETHVPCLPKEMGVSYDDHDDDDKVSTGFIMGFLGNITAHSYGLYKAFGEFAYMQYEVFFVHGFALFFWYFCGLSSGARLGNDGTPLEQKGVGKTLTDHYRWWSRLYPDKMRFKVFLSDLGMFVWAAILLRLGWNYGFLTVFLWFEYPNLLVNNWLLVTITWLQHTDPSVPHFGQEDWTWVKGALCGTIDHNYPWILDTASHSIATTHVCHHLFHEIPFYHATEATDALRAFLEPKGMYNRNPTPVYLTVFRVAASCHFVESIKGIQFYKSFADVLAIEAKSKKIE